MTTRAASTAQFNTRFISLVILSNTRNAEQRVSPWVDDDAAALAELEQVVAMWFLLPATSTASTASPILDDSKLRAGTKLDPAARTARCLTKGHNVALGLLLWTGAGEGAPAKELAAAII
jgi:hypothetical protein